MTIQTGIYNLLNCKLRAQFIIKLLFLIHLLQELT